MVDVSDEIVGRHIFKFVVLVAASIGVDICFADVKLCNAQSRDGRDAEGGGGDAARPRRRQTASYGSAERARGRTGPLVGDRGPGVWVTEVIGVVDGEDKWPCSSEGLPAERRDGSKEKKFGGAAGYWRISRIIDYYFEPIQLYQGRGHLNSVAP